MGFARAARCPVVLIADIDRGGVIAQLVGTLAVLDARAIAAMIAGFVINKFRGDARLFADGMRMIAERTSWRAFGLAPFFPEAARLPAEDAFGFWQRKRATRPRSRSPCRLSPASPISTTSIRLRLEPSVRLVFVKPGQPIPVSDCVILPGSKATIADLAFFRGQGWDIDLLAHVRRGGRVLGVCGGYQMLGKRVADPQGTEGPPGTVDGLGLLDVETVLTAEKTLERIEGENVLNGAPFAGYEMHVGRTTGRTAQGPCCASPTADSMAPSRRTAG